MHAYPSDSGLEAFPLHGPIYPFLFLFQRRKAYGVTQPQPLEVRSSREFLNV